MYLLLDLPDELLLSIFPFLDGKDRLALAFTCRALQGKALESFEQLGWDRDDKISRRYQTVFLRNFINSNTIIDESKLPTSWITKLKSLLKDHRLLTKTSEPDTEWHLLCLATLTILNGKEYIANRSPDSLSDLKQSFQRLVWLGKSSNDLDTLFFLLLKRISEHLNLSKFLTENNDPNAPYPLDIDTMLQEMKTDWTSKTSRQYRDDAFKKFSKIVAYLSPDHRGQFIDLTISILEDNGCFTSRRAKNILKEYKHFLSDEQTERVELCSPRIFELDAPHSDGSDTEISRQIPSFLQQLQKGKISKKDLYTAWDFLNETQKKSVIKAIISSLVQFSKNSKYDIWDDSLEAFYFTWPFFDTVQRQRIAPVALVILKKFGAVGLIASQLVWDYLDQGGKECVLQSLKYSVSSRAPTPILVCQALWPDLNDRQRNEVWQEIYYDLRLIFDSFCAELDEKYPMNVVSRYSLFHHADDRGEGDPSSTQESSMSI